MGGRRPATSGPIGRLEGDPDEAVAVGEASRPGAQRPLQGTSAPQILNELNQRLQQAGTGIWGR